MSVTIGETSNARNEEFVFYGFVTPEEQAVKALARACGGLRGVDTVFDDDVMELAAAPPLSAEQIASLEVAGQTRLIELESKLSKLATKMLPQPAITQPHFELIINRHPETVGPLEPLAA
jgi:hypothetical protein